MSGTGSVDGGCQDVYSLLVQLDAAGRREPEDLPPDLSHTTFETVDRSGLSGVWSTSLAAGADG